MPNFGALLKQEIARVSRKQIRAELETLKTASTQHRKTIQGLRAQITALEREVTALKKRAASPAKPDTRSADAPAVRFIAKGLKTHRARLGLSAGDFGRLVGVTAQSVYNWEQQTSRPRAEQVARIAALRKMGKREVTRILEQMTATQSAEASPSRARGK